MILDGATVVTMDAGRTEHATGHVVVENGRIAAVGAGRAPAELAGPRTDVTGCLVTPGLVNTHHHLYQWVTRGLAVDDGLFGWLTTLYPVWGGIDEDIVGAAAAAGLAWLARTGCTTSTDHHYVFPADGGDVLGAEIAAARRVGLRFMPTRGSMDLGRRDGGLPPDHVVEDIDTILAASAAAIDTHHDPGPDSMLRIGLAPCSPFSVTGDLLRQAAALARDKGVRLHTHLAETLDEEEFCRERFGAHPGGVHGGAGLAGRRRLAGPRHPLRRPGHREAGRHRDRGRALPVVQRPARRRHRAHRRPARRRGAGRARRGRRGQQRGLLADRGGPARPAVRPGPRRPAGAGRAGRAGAGHHRRRPAARLGRPRSAPWSRASRPTSRSGGSTAWRTPTSPTRSPPWCWARPRRWSCCWSAAARWSSGTAWSPSTSTNSPDPRSPRTASLLARASTVTCKEGTAS